MSQPRSSLPRDQLSNLEPLARLEEEPRTAPTAPGSPRAKRRRRLGEQVPPSVMPLPSAMPPARVTSEEREEVERSFSTSGASELTPSAPSVAGLWPPTGRVTLERLIPSGRPAPARLVLHPSRALAPRWKLVAAIVLGLLLILGGILGGQLLYRTMRVSRALARARALAAQERVPELRAALAEVQMARGHGKRQPAALALAAAIQGELAWRFAEGDLGELRALVDASARAGAEEQSPARRDFFLGRAYLALATNPLPEALGTLLTSAERDPQSTQLKLLYGEALLANGELELAQQVIDELPANNPHALEARALLHWRAGRQDLARQELAFAATQGLSRELATLDLARFRLEQHTETAETLEQLLSLSRRSRLPRRQLAWCQLLIAASYQHAEQLRAANAALDAALARPPFADLEFHYLASHVLLERQEITRAEQQALAAARLSPRNPRVVALLAAVRRAKQLPQKRS